MNGNGRQAAIRRSTNTQQSRTTVSEAHGARQVIRKTRPPGLFFGNLRARRPQAPRPVQHSSRQGMQNPCAVTLSMHPNPCPERNASQASSSRKSCSSIDVPPPVMVINLKQQNARKSLMINVSVTHTPSLCPAGDNGNKEYGAQGTVRSCTLKPAGPDCRSFQFSPSKNLCCIALATSRRLATGASSPQHKSRSAGGT